MKENNEGGAGPLFLAELVSNFSLNFSSFTCRSLAFVFHKNTFFYSVHYFGLVWCQPTDFAIASRILTYVTTYLLCDYYSIIRKYP